MIKKFSSPKIKIWFEPMFFSGFFCGFERCDSAAFPNFRGGNSSPPQVAKAVRTIFRILHHVGNCKFEGFFPPSSPPQYSFNFWVDKKYIHLKKFFHLRGFVIIHINTSRFGIIRISHRSPTWPYAISYFLP